MFPYLFLLLITAVIPLIAYQRRGVYATCDYSYLVEKRNHMTVFLFFMGLFVLLSLRDYTIGRDLAEYRYIFEICEVTAFNDLSDLRWENGYTVYNKLVTFITGDYRLFLIITALITVVPIYKLYSKEKKYSLLSIVIFINMPCFLIIFSGLRQAIAISIGIFVYMAIENKRYILSGLLLLLAVSFHVSAFVLILLYPIFFWKIKTNHLIYIIPVLLGVYAFRIPIFTLILSVSPEHYIEYYGEVQQTGAFGMMILFVIFVVFSFVILDESVMSKRDYFLRNILLIAAIFQLFVPIHGLIQRASYYFLIFVPISLLSVVQAPKKRLKSISNLAVAVMGIFFVVYFFLNATYSTDNLLDVFPYKFFWSGMGW